MPVLRAAAVLLALYGLLFAVERLLPLRRAKAALVGRLATNVVLTALTFASAALLVRPAVAAMLARETNEPLGLVHLLPLPPLGRAVLAFLLMDLAFYYWHLANHKAPFLWRFHNVHHLDPDLDVSTGFRFHAGEVALSVAFRVAQVTAIGISAGTFAVYELVFQASTLFHHSNLKLPIRVERLLNGILVTPRMHGIHHSWVRAETDSNFSVVFSLWDRLHGSLRLNVPQAALTIGVPGYARPEDNRAADAFLAPFRAQRPHWLGADGRAVERDSGDLDGPPTRLAE
jgi:sterol desaturase/sphingolipid hydroxylase (fatty acid hydroxylase superfamily)